MHACAIINIFLCVSYRHREKMCVGYVVCSQYKVNYKKVGLVALLYVWYNYVGTIIINVTVPC